MCFVSLGKATAHWLVAIVAELLNVEVTKEFLKSSIVGSKAFTTQRCANRFGRSLLMGNMWWWAVWLRHYTRGPRR